MQDFSILYPVIWASFYFILIILLFTTSVGFLFSIVTVILITYAAEWLSLHIIILFLSVVNGLFIYHWVSKLEQICVYYWETKQGMGEAMLVNLIFFYNRNSSTRRAQSC